MAQAVGEGGFFAGPYATMKFPKYRFQEYPKRITAPDGSRVRVVDASDELRVKATLPSERPQTEVERERNAVVAERDELAVTLDAKNAEMAELRENMAKMQSQMARLIEKGPAPAAAQGPDIPVVAPIGPSKPATASTVVLGTKK